MEFGVRTKDVGVYPQRMKNCDCLGNDEANLFDLKDMDKFKELKCGPAFVHAWFCSLIVEMSDMRRHF